MKTDSLFGILKLPLLANIYWLWLPVKLGSLSMFVVGLIPVSWIVTGPVGIWAFLFDVPPWVLSTFTQAGRLGRGVRAVAECRQA